MTSTTSGPRRPLWRPTTERLRAANLTRFIEYVNSTHHLDIGSYAELHDWSVREIADFWAVMWEFAGIRSSQAYETVIEDIRRFPGARWFTGTRLNFAENLLRFRDDRPALIFRSEGPRIASSLTHAQLYELVGRLSESLRKIGRAAR